MDSKSQEDFWNTSSFERFNFFDDEEPQPIQLEITAPENVFNPTVRESTNLPINALISTECLNLILDDIKSTQEPVVPPVEESIRKMFHGYKFSLDYYKTLKDKLLLLDSALETGDGNIIITVILFLQRTLIQNIFLTRLSKRQNAVKYYAQYLTAKRDYEALADLYMATGNVSQIKDIYYFINKDSQNRQTLLKKLEQFLGDHSINLTQTEDILDNIHFIQWQSSQKGSSASVIQQLAELCRKEWQSNKGDTKIAEFKKKFKIKDFQYEWTAMNVLAQLGLWKKLIEMFIKPNWLSKRNTIKSAVKQEPFVMGLSKHKPPSDVMEQFLQSMTDFHKSLQIAEKLQLHKFVINQYIAQRDRTALLSYRNRLTSQAHFLLIGNALQAGNIKWKN